MSTMRKAIMFLTQYLVLRIPIVTSGTCQTGYPALLRIVVPSRMSSGMLGQTCRTYQAEKKNAPECKSAGYPASSVHFRQGEVKQASVWVGLPALSNHMAVATLLYSMHGLWWVPGMFMRLSVAWYRTLCYACAAVAGYPARS